MTRTELERDVVAAAFSPHALPVLRRVVRPEHFADVGFRKCYEAACQLADDNSAVTVENAALLGARDTILTEATVFGQTAEPVLLARAMTEYVLREKLTAFVGEVSENDDVLELYRDLDELAAEGAALIGANKRRSKAEQLEDYSQQLQANARDGMRRISTGIPTLDRMLGGGFSPGNLSLLGGTEGTGKTSLALGLGVAAAKAGRRVVFISGEMPEQEILERLCGIYSGQDIDDIRKGGGPTGSFIKWFRELPFTLVPMFDRDPYSLRTALEYHAREADLLVVDYLQIFAGHGKQAQDEFYQIKKLSETLRGLALRRNVHLLCLSALNRSEEDKKSARSFYGSSGLGHDAAVAMLLMGEKRDTEEMFSRRRDVTLSVVKNRNGIRGDVNLLFDLASQRMNELFEAEPERVPAGNVYGVDSYGGNGRPVSG